MLKLMITEMIIKEIMSEKGFKIKVWFDKQINNDENKRYQKELRNKYSQFDFVPINRNDCIIN